MIDLVVFIIYVIDTISGVVFNMRLYDNATVQILLDTYARRNAEIITIREGVLGYGSMIIFGEGLKTAVVTEVYLNEWSSGHKIILYNKTPKKYLKIIEDYQEKLANEED